MHFGYWTWRTGAFDRERMLEQMNTEVMRRLEVPSGARWNIADLGCGLGATAASIGSAYPNSRITGLSIVPWQIEMGNSLLNARRVQNAILRQGDFAGDEFPEASMDAAYGVESMCYGSGLGKSDVIRSMARALKKGGRFVVADGFIRKEPSKFSRIFKGIYSTVTRNWALKDFAHIDRFKEALAENGFHVECVQEASWRIAPSALQVPFVTIKFLIDQIRKGERLNANRWGHLKACVCGLLMGMFRAQFGYYIISGYKK